MKISTPIALFCWLVVGIFLLSLVAGFLDAL